LFACPVRKRYLYQLWRYRRPTHRWKQALHGAPSGQSVEGLAEILRVAEEETGHYPRAFAEAGAHWGDLRSQCDLVHFPSLTRSTAQERWRELFSRRVTADDIDEGWLGATSGSTGEPVRFFMDAMSIHFFTAFVRFLWEREGCGADPGIGSTGIVLLCTLPRSAIYRTRLPLWRFTLFRKLHWSEPEAPRQLETMAPAVVTGDPDSLQRLAEALEAHELELAPRLILSSAWAMPDALAQRLRELTGAAVVDYYSLAETGPVAWRCTAGTGRLHLLEGAVEVEEQNGELLLTNLRNRLFPLVRYHTGDLARLEPARPCACGARGSSIVEFSGRVAARFVACDGSRADPSQLQPLLSALPLRQFQLVQTARDEVLLRYSGEREIAPPSAAPIAQALPRLLGRPTSLRLEHLDAPLFLAGEKPIVYRSLLEI